MAKMNQNDWRQLMVTSLQSGTVNIPYGLLKFYKQLNLSEAEAMLLMHILSFREIEGKTFPTVHELQERMSVPAKDVVKYLRELVKKQYIAIVEETDENGLRGSRYDVQPLFEKLADCYIQQMGARVIQKEEQREAGLVTKFEQEFGRPLSPMECEILVKWLEEDRLSDELILAALKEAVFTGKLNFKYIDRILLEWKKNNVNNVEQAKQHALKFRKKGSIYQSTEKRQHTDDFPFYNWLKS